MEINYPSSVPDLPRGIWSRTRNDVTDREIDLAILRHLASDLLPNRQRYLIVEGLIQEEDLQAR